MAAFESHEALIAHHGHHCDSSFRAAIDAGVAQPVIVLFDLMDPAAREVAIVSKVIDSEFVEKLCARAEPEDDPVTFNCCITRDDLCQMLAEAPGEYRVLLDEPIPEECYLLAVYGAGRFALHQRRLTV